MKQKKELLRENPQIMAHEDFMEDMEIKIPLLLILTGIRIQKSFTANHVLIISFQPYDNAKSIH